MLQTPDPSEQLTQWRRQVIRFEGQIQQLASGATSLEGAAQVIARELHERLVSPSGSKNSVLVRLFKTHPFESLPSELQRFARSAAPSDGLNPTTPCLTLIGTAGVREQWNCRSASIGHQAIPLTSAEMIQQSPMIAQLLSQFGLELDAVLTPGDNAPPKSPGGIYELFHVQNAAGSPIIPAQKQFVEPFGVKSVVGFGGPLSSGDLYAAILFFSVPVPPEVAALFRSVALTIKIELLRFAIRATFSESSVTSTVDYPA
ncbi:MAG: hypothetical protein LC772_07280 [Chloroflexi bacterium]|nr:hypothetical protein [Chloroflexota bacterium]